MTASRRWLTGLVVASCVAATPASGADFWGGFAGGAIGGAAGTAITGYFMNRPRQQQQYYSPSQMPATDGSGRPMYAPEAQPDPVAWCASRFKSYDPRTGFYRGYDGYLRRCP